MPNLLTETEALQAVGSPAGLAYAISAYTDAKGRRRHRWLPYPHLRILNDAILRAVSGDLHRQGKTGLIVSMPPRHGKSELVSKTTPAWFLGRFPERKVMFASYQAQFAASWGRKARDLLEEFGPELFGVTVSDSSSAADDWQVAGHGGSMSTAGIGGPFTGRGADLLLIDDPVKNHEEAHSELIRDKHWDWWLSTARTRLHAGGTAIIVATRWHEDDLIGRLLAQAAADPDADQWEVINLPAIAEPDEETGELDDPLGRKAGEALCPQLGYDEKWAKRTRASVGSYVWHALYQGKPRPAEGLLFKRPHFRYYRGWDPELARDAIVKLEGEDDELTAAGLEHMTIFQTVDVAASEKEDADYTVVSTWAVTADREMLLIDRRRQRFDVLDVGGFVATAYFRWLPSFVSVERLGHGLTVIQELVRKGLPIRKLEADADKVARALVAVARYEEGKIRHPREAPWLSEWEDELLAFPNGANDDQVDTVAYAARELAMLSGVKRKQQDRGKTHFGGLRNKRL